MLKFLKMLIGISLFPFCWAVSTASYRLHQSSIDSATISGWEAWALPIGFLIWIALFLPLPRPARTYVLGHELTHALWALMMGGRVGKIKIGKAGGHVELTKSNFLITLAPYFFPFYTVIIIATYYLAGLIVTLEPHRAWWLGAVGLTWSFHITFTIHALSQRQTDVQEHGRIFSYSVIYIMNVIIIGLWTVWVSPLHITEYGTMLKQESVGIYNLVYQQILFGWSMIMP